MNISQAKQIPISKLIERFGGRFSHAGRNGETWWHSPFRPDEKTASFKVDTHKNTWHDFARTEKVDAHGDILDLWTDYHNLPRRESNALKQALAGLRDFGSISPVTRKCDTKPIRAKALEEPRYKIVKAPGQIWMNHLKQEIGRRGLSLSIIQSALRQVQIQDTKTKRKYHGFGFENDKGGWEISIPNPNRDQSFKLCIGSKSITSYFSGQHYPVYIFEGFWDYFTWVQMNKGKDMYDWIILNSVSMRQYACDTIVSKRNTTQGAFSFMDNDTAGEETTDFLATQFDEQAITFGTKNHIYEGFKDLNDYWIKSANKLL